jgi:predicted nuclease of predicted toxin-antitoxin system
VADRLAVLLDQNVPRAVVRWLQETRPSWDVHHAVTAGLSGKSDLEVFQWAQSRAAMIITFDEDFADRRSFSMGEHYGIVRLRV